MLALALGPSIARVLNMKKNSVCFVVFQLLTSSMSRALGSFVCLGNTVAVVVEDGMGLFLDRNSGSYTHLKKPIPRNFTPFEMSAMVTVTIDGFQPGLDQKEVSLKISKIFFHDAVCAVEDKDKNKYTLSSYQLLRSIEITNDESGGVILRLMDEYLSPYRAEPTQYCQDMSDANDEDALETVAERLGPLSKAKCTAAWRRLAALFDGMQVCFCVHTANC